MIRSGDAGSAARAAPRARFDGVGGACNRNSGDLGTAGMLVRVEAQIGMVLSGGRRSRRMCPTASAGTSFNTRK